MIGGAGQIITNTSKGATFRADIDYSNFSGVWINGSAIAPSNFDSESGSTIVKLKPAYLATLSQGKYIITIIAKDGGMASAEFTIGTHANTQTGAPQTGDNSNMLLWIALLFVSGGAALTLTVTSKKRRQHSED